MRIIVQPACIRTTRFVQTGLLSGVLKYPARIGAGLLAGVIAATACAQESSIALRPFARVQPGEPVRLSQVADIGAGAPKSLGDLVLLESGHVAAGGVVDLRTVRIAVEAAPGINSGRLVFSGSECKLRIAEADKPAPVVSRDVPASMAEGTVRQCIAIRIAETLGVPQGDLRLTFEEHQTELLNTPAGGRVVTAQCTGAGERMTIAVRVYQGDTLLVQGSVRVGVQIRRDVVVAQTPIARGDAVDPDALSHEEQWLNPSVKPADGARVAGRVARDRINAGEVVEERDVEPQISVKKGSLVTLDCISGQVVVRTTARALADGRDGETITMETLQWKKSVLAKVSGPGRAVAVGEAPAAPGGKGTAPEKRVTRTRK